MLKSKIYCMCLHEHHLDNLIKLKYIPVGLGSHEFSDNWLKDNTKINISKKILIMESILFITGFGKIF